MPAQCNQTKPRRDAGTTLKLRVGVGANVSRGPSNPYPILKTPGLAPLFPKFTCQNKEKMSVIDSSKLGGRRPHSQGWICRLPGARENITACGVAPVLVSTHRVS